MNKLTVFGRLIQAAVRQKTRSTGKPYSRHRLALDAKMMPPHLLRACRGESGISVEMVRRLCDALGCDERMQAALLNAAGYASAKEVRSTEEYLQALEEEQEDEALRRAG